MEAQSGKVTAIVRVCLFTYVDPYLSLCHPQSIESQAEIFDQLDCLFEPLEASADVRHLVVQCRLHCDSAGNHSCHFHEVAALRVVGRPDAYRNRSYGRSRARNGPLWA